MRQIQIMGGAATLNKIAYQCMCTSQVYTRAQLLEAWLALTSV